MRNCVLARRDGRAVRLVALLSVCFLSAPAAAAIAPACPPNALGPSRELLLGTKGGFAIGLKTYPQSLNLADHEIVLTFDDGPSARTTPMVLAALAKQCVRANFFVVGRNAAAHPALVRREIAMGEVVGHHTYSHPAITLRLMSEAAARANIERGFAADDKAAYGRIAYAPLATMGRGKALVAPRVPFFRFPGFADTPALDAWLKSQNIGIFGADLWASDWRTMTPHQELRLVLARLAKARRGILLLHDTRLSTAKMLPQLLVDLKKRGYHIVQLVPDKGPPPKFRHAPKGWHSETEAILAKIIPRLRRMAAKRSASKPHVEAPRDNGQEPLQLPEPR